MIVTFVFPSPANPAYHRTGGLLVLYRFADGLARLGHEVHFLHGPAWPGRIDSLDQLPPFAFDAGVLHHLVDSFDEPGLPAADVMFHQEPPLGAGLPAVIVQGFRMLPREVERAAYRARAPKFCVASWLVDVGCRFGVPPEQLIHVPLGLDHDVFACRTPLDERPIDVVMIYNGHHQKGWKSGLAALHEVRRRRADVNGVVFGMLQPAEELPAGFRFVGGLDHRELADEVYNRARVFVQPSIHEGFGYPAVEAMACGAALVTTDNGGSRDYGFHGETAWVVPPGDSAGLADRVLHLLADDATRTRFALAGVERARVFDWERSAAVMAEHLERYLADPARFQLPPDPYEEWEGHGLGEEVHS